MERKFSRCQILSDDEDVHCLFSVVVRLFDDTTNNETNDCENERLQMFHLLGSEGVFQ